MERTLPEKGFVFWPVGNGDSTSIILNDSDWIQVDMNQTEATDGKVAIIDELIGNLPQREGKPYLSVFALTHPDQDHCKGFKELLDQITIGELWFTPRVFEDREELCEDAEEFQKEAIRRIQETSKSSDATPSGDKAKIIGYHETCKDAYPEFPLEQIVVPGEYIENYDGVDISEEELKIFIHAPLKEAIEEERNSTSLAMQVSINEGDKWNKALLFGDLSYPRIKRIFEITEEHKNEETLEWNVLLAPHHCSKSVMFHKNEDGKYEYKNEIIDKLAEYQDGEGLIISSSDNIPASNKKGENPPHAKAKAKYLSIVDSNNFICTEEHSSESSPMPVIIEQEEGIISVRGDNSPRVINKPAVEEALREVEGDPQPPSGSVRYGRY